MPAKIKHIAIVSDQYALEGRFYEAVFGMRSAADKRPERAVTISDGNVGLNINPRKAGRPAGLDHFGVEVEDAELPDLAGGIDDAGLGLPAEHGPWRTGWAIGKSHPARSQRHPLLHCSRQCMGSRCAHWTRNLAL